MADRQGTSVALLSEIGELTAAEATRLQAASGGEQLELLKPETAAAAKPELLRTLSDALCGNREWSDEFAAHLLRGLASRLRTASVDPNHVGKWILVHPGNPDAVLDCLDVVPPRGFSVLRLLSRAGSQKVVYLARWDIAQREVVLKRFIGGDSASKVLLRELQPHPLSMIHPSIIETHCFENDAQERFLVERRLPEVLSDAWRSQGNQEAANLLRDLAGALSFLVERGLVHGDIKPDNIGLEEGRYIVLDFGVCRPAEKFADEKTATGSLRTRAPEILGGCAATHASDVWALGATVFNVLVGRFPLLNEGEVPPRISDEHARRAFEGVLARRATTEWQQRVADAAVPDPLGPLVREALLRDPARRITASELARRCDKDLAAFLRTHDGPTASSPVETLTQLDRYLPASPVLALMANHHRKALKEFLTGLQQLGGMTPAQLSTVDALLGRLGQEPSVQIEVV